MEARSYHSSPAVYKNLPITQATVIYKNLPITQATAIYKNQPITQATVIYKNLPITQAKNQPITQATVIYKNQPAPCRSLLPIAPAASACWLYGSNLLLFSHSHACNNATRPQYSPLHAGCTNHTSCSSHTVMHATTQHAPIIVIHLLAVRFKPPALLTQSCMQQRNTPPI